MLEIGYIVARQSLYLGEELLHILILQNLVYVIHSYTNMKPENRILRSNLLT